MLLCIYFGTVTSSHVHTHRLVFRNAPTTNETTIINGLSLIIPARMTWIHIHIQSQSNFVPSQVTDRLPYYQSGVRIVNCGGTGWVIFPRTP